MPDVILDAGEQVRVECNNLYVQGHDLLLDSPTRRRPNDPAGFRRALVHDANDGLTINYAGDYPGGVILNGVAELRPLQKPGGLLHAAPNLVVRGGISYEVHGATVFGGGMPTTTTVNVGEELYKLQSQLAELLVRIAALEARP